MNVAITGASGHVGNNLARELLELGNNVNALCHRDLRALEGLDLKRIQGNVLSSDSLLACFKETEVVYHLASVISIDGDRRGVVRGINETGTRFVVKACIKSGVRRLVHFSSIHALEQFPLNEVLDESRPLVGPNGTIYDRSKAEAERIALNGMQSGLEVVIISPTGVIGPHDYKPSLMGTGIMAMYQGKLPALVEGGFDWVDVRDVVQGTIQVCEKGISGERFLLSGHWVSVEKLAKQISSLSGIPAPRFTAPYWMASLGLPILRILGRFSDLTALFTKESLSTLAKANRNISHKNASELFGYQPRPLQKTLEDTFNWYNEARMMVTST
jgi:dihydroflavonol-4-reductase